MREHARRLFLDAIRDNLKQLHRAAHPRSEAGSAIGDREARDLARGIADALAAKHFHRLVAEDVGRFLTDAHQAGVERLAGAVADTLLGAPADEVGRKLSHFDDRVVRDAERAMVDLEKALGAWAREWDETLMNLAEAMRLR